MKCMYIIHNYKDFPPVISEACYDSTHEAFAEAYDWIGDTPLSGIKITIALCMIEHIHD